MEGPHFYPFFPFSHGEFILGFGKRATQPKGIGFFFQNPRVGGKKGPFNLFPFFLILTWGKNPPNLGIFSPQLGVPQNLGDWIGFLEVGETNPGIFWS